MGFRGITSDTSTHLQGAATYNAVITGSGVISALIAMASTLTTPATIVIHDTLNATTGPNPLLTIYVEQRHSVQFCRPVQQGLYFATGISVIITGTASLHFTAHLENTP